MAKVTHEFDLYGKHYTLETGELAKQATGAVLVKQGDSTVLVTAVVSKERKNYDFFPLTVDFIEKMYAVGRIPGGYLKREARPSEKATLTARMIDRPLRPSFPAGFRNEVQVVATSLVADQENPVDVICVMAASSALTVGGVPFEGPLACVRIGRDPEAGEFLVNPSYEQRDVSDLDLELAGTPDYISMVEASASEISEEDMLAAMAFGQEAIASFCEEQKKFFAKVVEVNGTIEQHEYLYDEPVAEVHERIFAHEAEMSAALKDADKLARMGKVDQLKEAIKAEFSTEEQETWSREIPVELKSLEKHAMRCMVVETGERVDGRAADEIRPLMVKPDYLPRVHGSGLFQRGQTQVLSVATLGMLNEWQRLDTIEPVDGKRYIHHYNFPPYCTGETGRMGTPKRREIGHGNLAERALLPVIPSEEEFPYTIRVVSEVMESNGSSSMASTCGSTLALMDAGVPLLRPVSGIAMGLIQEEGETVVLSDIQGLEDFLGDMDFKVTGTERGITAMQMDNKATGLTPEILAQALHQAREGRAFILNTMLEAVGEPRQKPKDSAPQIISIQIPTDKIREVIGAGGKVIRGIQEDTGATIDIQEDGNVFIAGTSGAGQEAAARIKAIVKVPEVGEEYNGRVVGIQPFGAFIELLPGKDGLLHISRVAQGRVDKVEDVLSVGDEVRVKVLEVDEKGKISLDRLDKPEAPAGAKSSHGSGDRHTNGSHHRGSGEHHTSTGEHRNSSDSSERHSSSEATSARRPHRHPGDNGNAGRAPRRHHEG